MGTSPAFSTSLFSTSEAAAGLSEEARAEYVGLGILLDWELTKFLARAGWRLVRQSYTLKDDEVLLVIKILVAEVPYVVFISDTSPMGCMRRLVRKLGENTLALYPDKFS